MDEKWFEEFQTSVAFPNERAGAAALKYYYFYSYNSKAIITLCLTTVLSRSVKERLAVTTQLHVTHKCCICMPNKFPTGCNGKQNEVYLHMVNVAISENICICACNRRLKFYQNRMCNKMRIFI